MSTGSVSQASVFLSSEGDAWFARNPEAAEEIRSPDLVTIERVLGPYASRINRILEIGCGNGAKLAQLSRFFGAQAEGIDPSGEAVSRGKSSGLSLQVGTADCLPYADASFDFVFFGFCLYLVDRFDMMKVVAEADRVLRPGGFLAILDFDPSFRHRRHYHHKPGLFSYKTQYGDYFLIGGHYHLVAKDSFAHGQDFFSEDPNERIALSILYREVEPYPQVS